MKNRKEIVANILTGLALCNISHTENTILSNLCDTNDFIFICRETVPFLVGKEIHTTCIHLSNWCTSLPLIFLVSINVPCLFFEPLPNCTVREMWWTSHVNAQNEMQMATSFLSLSLSLYIYIYIDLSRLYTNESNVDLSLFRYGLPYQFSYLLFYMIFLIFLKYSSKISSTYFFEFLHRRPLAF